MTVRSTKGRGILSPATLPISSPGTRISDIPVKSPGKPPEPRLVTGVLKSPAGDVIVVNPKTGRARVLRSAARRERAVRGGEISLVPPSEGDVRAYCIERGHTISPAQFVSYYTATGWRMRNNVPIINWRAACDLWNLRQKEWDW